MTFVAVTLLLVAIASQAVFAAVSPDTHWTDIPTPDSAPFFVLLQLHVSNVPDNAIIEFSRRYISLRQQYSAQLEKNSAKGMIKDRVFPKLPAAGMICLDVQSTSMEKICNDFEAQMRRLLRKFLPEVDSLSHMVHAESEYLVPTTLPPNAPRVQVERLSETIDFSRQPRILQTVLTAIELNLERAAGILFKEVSFSLGIYAACYADLNNGIAKAVSYLTRFLVPVTVLQTADSWAAQHVRSSFLSYLQFKFTSQTEMRHPKPITPSVPLKSAVPMILPCPKAHMSSIVLSVLGAAKKVFTDIMFGQFMSCLFLVIKGVVSQSQFPPDKQHSQTIGTVLNNLLGTVSQWNQLQSTGRDFGFNDYFHAITIIAPMIERFKAEKDTESIQRILRWAKQFELFYIHAGDHFITLDVVNCLFHARAFYSLKCLLSQIIEATIDYNPPVYTLQPVKYIFQNGGPDLNGVNRNVFGLTPVCQSNLSSLIDTLFAGNEEGKLQLMLILHTLDAKMMSMQAIPMSYSQMKIPEKYMEMFSDNLYHEVNCIRRQYPEMPVDALQPINHHIDFTIQLYKNRARTIVLPAHDIDIQTPTPLQYFERQFVYAHFLKAEHGSERVVGNIARALGRMLQAEFREFCKLESDKNIIGRAFYSTITYLLVLVTQSIV